MENQATLLQLNEPAAQKEAIIYAAGLFDGEGFVTIQREKGNTIRYNLITGIQMTNRAGIEYLAANFGGKIRKYLHKNPNFLPAYTWVLYGHKAHHFLKTILPFLKVKRQDAEIGIKFVEGYFSDPLLVPKRPVNLQRVSLGEECRNQLLALHNNRNVNHSRRKKSQCQLSLL
jgi:hypothetical protein